MSVETGAQTKTEAAVTSRHGHELHRFESAHITHSIYDMYALEYTGQRTGVRELERDRP